MLMKVFHEHIKSFTCFIRAAELTSVRYLQMDPTEINTAALHSSRILAVIHQRDEHHYRQTKHNKLSSESQRWLIILDVFVFSPDQGCNEDEPTNRKNPKCPALADMFVCKMWRPILTHCQSVLLPLAHFLCTFSTEKLPFAQETPIIG